MPDVRHTRLSIFRIDVAVPATQLFFLEWPFMAGSGLAQAPASDPLWTFHRKQMQLGRLFSYLKLANEFWFCTRVSRSYAAPLSFSKNSASLIRLPNEAKDFPIDVSADKFPSAFNLLIASSTYCSSSATIRTGSVDLSSMA